MGRWTHRDQTRTVLSFARHGFGVLLMLLGLLLLGVGTALEMAHVRQARWFERPFVVAPLALALLLCGAALTAT